MFSCEYFEIFKKNFCYGTTPVAAFEASYVIKAGMLNSLLICYTAFNVRVYCKFAEFVANPVTFALDENFSVC